MHMAAAGISAVLGHFDVENEQFNGSCFGANWNVHSRHKGGKLLMLARLLQLI